jgi:hypothetical protein
MGDERQPLIDLRKAVRESWNDGVIAEHMDRAFFEALTGGNMPCGKKRKGGGRRKPPGYGKGR